MHEFRIILLRDKQRQTDKQTNENITSLAEVKTAQKTKAGSTGTLLRYRIDFVSHRLQMNQMMKFRITIM